MTILLDIDNIDSGFLRARSIRERKDETSGFDSSAPFDATDLASGSSLMPFHVITSCCRKLVALAPLVVAACAVPGPAHDAADRFPEPRRIALDAALDRSFGESKVPGVVVGVWIPGEGTYVTARGTRNPATNAPMRTDDHFRVGSITKTFTVTTLLILADEGRLRLDDPVVKYLPFVPNGGSITLRMLSNMTSGLYNYTEDDAWVTRAFGDFRREWTPRELVDVGLAHPPYFPPGTGWHYSNTNTVLLGMIIEQVTRKRIGDVFAEKLFRPLGLSQTSWPTTSSLPEPYAHGVTVQTLNGQLDDATHRNPSWAFTAGAIVSTLADLKRWVQSYATGTLLSAEMQRERLTWVTLAPNSPVRAYGLGIGTDHGWLGHTGELPGYNACAYYLPAKGAVIVVLVNSDIAVAGVDPAPRIMKALAAVVTPNNVPQ